MAVAQSSVARAWLEVVLNVPLSWLQETGRGPDGSVQRSGWAREAGAGAIGALLLFAIAVPVGALAFAPLGARFSGFAVAAGMAGGVVGGILGAVASGHPRLRTGPMTAAALVLAAVLATLLEVPHLRASGPGGVPYAVTGALAAMAMGGVLQVVFGVSRLGGIVNFTPRPVLAGFRNGVALLIILGQLSVLLGLSGALFTYDLRSMSQAWSPWSLLAGVVGVVAIVATRLGGGMALAPLAGILATSAAYYLLRYAGVDNVGALIGPLPAPLDLAGAWQWAAPFPAVGSMAAWGALATGAVSLAMVGAVLTLLAARAIEDSPLARRDSNRLLVGQGVANIGAALAGGVPVAGSLVQSQAMDRAGGRARLAGIVASVLLGVAAFAFQGAIAAIPLVALAVVMLMIGWDTFDRETRTLLRDVLRPGAHRVSRVQDLAVVALVTLNAVLFGVVVGVLTGIVVSAVLFAVASSATIVRRHSTGAFRRSMRKRSEFESRRLDHAGARTAILELQGALFFGNADALAQTVLREAASARFAIFDLTRVHTIDATGTHLLRRLREHLRRDGGELLLAGCRERTQTRAVLTVPDDEDPWVFFPDADRALEWCENQALAELTVDTTFHHELAFDRMDICQRLDPRQIAALQARSERATFPAGTRLFAMGMRGDEIHLLAHGRVSLVLDRDDGRTGRRLATYGPGMVFGEMAVLESRVRTATARCDTDVVTWRITRAGLRAIANEDPGLGVAVYRALARILAGRLRETTRELRDTSEP